VVYFFRNMREQL